MASSSTNPAQQSPEELRTKLPNEIWEMCFAYVYKDVGFQEVESGNFKSFYFNQPGDPDETASAVSSLKPIALMAMNNAGRWLFRGYQKPGQAFERFIQQHHARALSIKKMDWQLDEFDIAAPEGDNGFPVTSIKKHCKNLEEILLVITPHREQADAAAAMLQEQGIDASWIKPFKDLKGLGLDTFKIELLVGDVDYVKLQKIKSDLKTHVLGK